MKTTIDARGKIPVRLQKLARFMDNSIPLPGGFRIGWDAIIGLVPGIGDLFGTMVSGYIVIEGVKLGAPKSVILRMILNMVIEGTIGVLPVIGDLFDMGFKANVRNVELLTNHSLEPIETNKKSRFGLILLAIAAIVFCLLLLWAAYSLLIYMLQVLF